MNCDEVFDHLTRGPVPAGDPADDAAIDRHLAACHDCRRLAEALRPAVDLFHEALLTEPDDLPCYRGSLPVVGDDRTSSGTVAVAARPTAGRGPSRRSTSRVAGFAALGLVAAVAMWIGSGQPRGAVASSDTALQRVDESRALQLTAAGLRDDCRPRVVVRDDEAGHVLQCCAACHAPHRPATRNTASVATLSNSCLVCHDDTSARTNGMSFDLLLAVTDLRG